MNDAALDKYIRDKKAYEDTFSDFDNPIVDTTDEEKTPTIGTPVIPTSKLADFISNSDRSDPKTVEDSPDVDVVEADPTNKIKLHSFEDTMIKFSGIENIDSLLKLATKEDFSNLFGDTAVNQDTNNKQETYNINKLFMNNQISDDMKDVVKRYKDNAVGMTAYDNSDNLVNIDEDLYYNILHSLGKEKETEKIDTTKTLSHFNKDGFKVDSFKSFKVLPYYVLQLVDRMGEKVINKKVEYNGEEMIVGEKVFHAAQQAINFLKSRYKSLDDAIRILTSMNISEDDINNARKSSIMMEYIRTVQTAVTGEDMRFAGINSLDELIKKAELTSSTVENPELKEGYGEDEPKNENLGIKLQSYSNLDNMVRAAYWAETVDGFTKIALEVGPENELREKLLKYIEKDEQKYRGKIRKYKSELERIKEMKKQLLNGASFDEVNRGLLEPEMINENEDELNERLEENPLKEMSEQEVQDRYNKELWK